MIISTIATASYFKPLNGFPLRKVLQVAQNYQHSTRVTQTLGFSNHTDLFQLLYSLFTVSSQSLCTRGSHKLKLSASELFPLRFFFFFFYIPYLGYLFVVLVDPSSNTYLSFYTVPSVGKPFS